MRRLAELDVDDVSVCSDAIRGLGSGAATMEEAASLVAHYLHDELGDEHGNRVLALVRVYKTHAYAALPADLREFAHGLLGVEPPPADLRCLTLLGTAGDLPEWNDRRASAGHRAIPLVSEPMVEQLPMVVQLITQLGLDVASVVRPDPSRAAALAQRTYDVFHVPVAAGSPHVPAQDFVREHGIESAVGFGGMLYTGDFYAVVLFSKTPISSDVAQLLKILSLAVRVPLLAHLRRVFA